MVEYKHELLCANSSMVHCSCQHQLFLNLRAVILRLLSLQRIATYLAEHIILAVPSNLWTDYVSAFHFPYLCTGFDVRSICLVGGSTYTLEHRYTAG